MAVRLQDLRARAHERLDVLLAIAILLEPLIEVSGADASASARLAILGPSSLMAAAMLMRRRQPLVSLTLGALALLAINLLDPVVADTLEALYFAWLFIAYSMAVHVETGRELWTGVAIGLAMTIAFTLTGAGNNDDVDLPGALFGSLIFVGAPVFAGRMLHARLRLNQALRDKADRAHRDQASHAAEAAADERARIAGELHDVVAHALGAMTIQAAAARRLATEDPARAANSLEAVEAAGRGALAELRTLLDVLRAEEINDAEAAREPQPGLGALAGLAARARDAGLPVELDVDGDRPADLATGIDVTAYRVVQEALGEALRSGSAGTARVQVRFGEDEIEIEIADDGVRAAGRRLLGLRERVRMYGGEVDVDAAGSGGHVVRARLPLEGVRVNFRWYLLAAAGLTIAGVVDVLSTDAELEGPLVLNLAAIGVYGGLVLLLHTRPLPAIYGFLALLLVTTLLLTPPPEIIIFFVGLLIFPFAAGSRVSGWRSLIYVPLVLVVVSVVNVTSDIDRLTEYVFPTALALVAFFAGRNVVHRTRLAAELHEAALLAEERSEAEARRAVAAERRRIAHEMHDVVGHSITLMVVQAGGARRILERDPERARAAAEQIERTGQETLLEMRRVLGIMRSPSTVDPS